MIQKRNNFHLACAWQYHFVWGWAESSLPCGAQLIPCHPKVSDIATQPSTQNVYSGSFVIRTTRLRDLYSCSMFCCLCCRTT